MYIVLGVLYESYIHPITILSTLPSAGVGAILSLLIFRTDLSVIALIGIILLIGIVKKNGIMMVDFALDAEREEGKAPVDAIYQACLLRFRPIMMTTMSAILGAVPLAFGGGMGAELRQPLGITIIGGLIFSQILTLYTTPVIYLWFDRVGKRLGCEALNQGANEHLNTIYPKTCCDHPLDGGDRSGRVGCGWFIACISPCRRWTFRPSVYQRACPEQALRPWPLQLRHRWSVSLPISRASLK